MTGHQVGDARKRVPDEAESPEEELRRRVFEALGTASVCWSEVPTGTFDATLAQQVGRDLISWIDATFVRVDI